MVEYPPFTAQLGEMTQVCTTLGDNWEQYVVFFSLFPLAHTDSLVKLSVSKTLGT